MPLHYVLFFPIGRPAWSSSLRRVDAEEKSRNKMVSQRADVRCQLYEREGVFNPILAGTRLGQQHRFHIFLRLNDAREDEEHTALVMLSLCISSKYINLNLGCIAVHA